MTHASMTPEARAEAGISETLIRLSIGLEAVEDLLSDLDRALDIAASNVIFIGTGAEGA